MTKVELQVEVNRLQEELANLKHLGTTIASKDNEISTLSAVNENLRRENNRLRQFEHLGTTVTEKDKAIADLKKEHADAIKALKDQFETDKAVIMKNFKTQNDNVLQLADARKRVIEMYGFRYNDLLKGIQAFVDTHAHLGEYLNMEYERLNPKKVEGE